MNLDGTHQKRICPNCGREIQVANYNRHYKACTEGYKNKKSRHEIIFTETLICPFCDRQSKNKNSYSQHYIRCAKNPNRDYSITNNFANYIMNNRKGKNKYNCPEIAKQVATMREKYNNGYVSNKELGSKPEHIYNEQNQEEINKWLEYISSIKINKNYETRNHSEGYKVISKSQIKENNSIKLTFEHNYIANILLNNNLDKNNCVHHINEDKADNNKNNLLIFVDGSNHKRYHWSKYARLVYDENTHLFSCYADKTCPPAKTI